MKKLKHNSIIFWKGLLVALGLMLSYFPVKGYTFIDGLYYELSSTDRTAEVVKDLEDSYSFISPDLSIPETISYDNKTYTVTAIGFRAFENVSSLSSIKLPPSITTIKEYAFSKCTNLTEIILNEGLLNIQDAAFANCSNLEYISIPASVEKIGITNVYGSNGLADDTTNKEYPEYYFAGEKLPFYNCTKLKKVRFEDSESEINLGVGYVGWYAPHDPNCPSEYARGLFYYCPLEELYLGRNVTYKNYGSTSDISSNSSFILHPRYYGYSAFYNNSNLARISLGTKVDYVKDYLFCGNANIQTILALRQTPPSVGSIPFNNYNATLYAEPSFINDYSGSSWKFIKTPYIEDDIYWYVPISTKNAMVTAKTVSETKEIEIPDTIMNEYGRPLLVTEIMDEAFANWGSIQTLTIPSTITSIGNLSFKNDVITDIYCNAEEVPKIYYDTFSDYSATLHVPNEAVAKYSNHRYWSKFRKILPLVEVKAESIELNKTELNLLIGDATQLTATIYPSNTSDTEIVWSSDNIEIAKVSSTGEIFGVSEGTTTITAKCGEVSAFCRVTVHPIPATEIVLNNEKLELELGRTEQLKAEIFPENTTHKDIVWTSTNTSVATVNGEGLIKAVGIGNAQITAACGNVSATCDIEIFKFDISIDEASVVLELGTTRQLEATVLPEKEDNLIIWSSNNPSIATVSSTGLITAVSVGTTEIIATCGLSKVTCKVQVVISATGLTLYSNYISLLRTPTYQQKKQLEVSLTPYNTTDEVIWESMDSNIATVSSSGLVTAISTGETTIKVRCGEIEKSCVVDCIYTDYNTFTEYTEDFKNAYVWLPTGVSETPKRAEKYRSPKTDINYTLYNGTIDENLKVGLFLFPGGYLEFEAPDNLLRLTLTSRSSYNFTIFANDKRIKSVQLTQNDSYGVGDYYYIWNVPEEYQKKGTVFKIRQDLNTGGSLLGLTYQCYISLTGFHLDKENVSLKPGEKLQINATIEPVSAKGEIISWSSDNESVVKVAPDGMITAIGAGSATITATCHEFNATCKVIVSGGSYFEEFSIYEDFTKSNTGLPTGSANKPSSTTRYVSNTTGISYDIMGCYINNYSQPSYLLINGKSDNGAFISFALDYDCTEIIMQTSATGSTNSSSAVYIYADGNRIGRYKVNVPNQTISIPIPYEYQGKGTTYKIESTSEGYNQQFYGFTYVCNQIVEIPVSKITLNKTEITLGVGDTEQLSTIIEPSNASQADILWKSGNEKIATVSENGLITAVGVGKTTITASIGDVNASCSVEVKEIKPSEIILNKNFVELTIGDSEQLYAEVLPANTTNKTIVWESSDSGVVSVSQDGLIQANGIGNAIITATSGEISASCEIVVHPIEVQSISLNITETTMDVGQTEKLIASILPENSTNQTILWSSSNENIAKVSSEGIVEAIGVGEADITATCGSVSANCHVAVIISATDIVLDVDNLSLKIDETYQLKAVIEPLDATNQEIEWNTDDEDIATVTKDGMVKGVGIGSTNITARCGNIYAVCAITVSGPEPQSIILNISEVTLKIGESKQLEATVYPEDLPEVSITWESEDSSIATVSESGTVIALKAGVTEITATCGTLSASCTVIVNEVEPETVILNKSELTLNIGESEILSASILPENTTDKTILWISEDEDIASVTDKGLVTALQTGHTKITAICGSVSASCVVTVIEQEIPVELEVTEDFTLSNTGLPEGAGAKPSTVKNYTSKKTGIDYSIMGCYINNNYTPSYLFVNGKYNEGAFISFTLDKNCKAIKMNTTSSCSTNSNSAVNVYANDILIGQYSVNRQNAEYTIEIPNEYQTAGITYKIESATTAYNQQFLSFTYVCYTKGNDYNNAFIESIPNSEEIIVFNLQGYRLGISTREELQYLEPGIYIINGKKVMIK